MSTMAMPTENVFLDTWAFLALANRRDCNHQIAVYAYDEIRKGAYSMVTSDYVLDETITALFKKGNFEGAIKFINALFMENKGEVASWQQWIAAS